MISSDDYPIDISGESQPKLRHHRAEMSPSRSFDNSIHHSIKQKRLSQTFGNQFLQETILQENHTYDQFLIVGCPLISDLLPFSDINNNNNDNNENNTNSNSNNNSDNNIQPKILMIYPSAPPLFKPAEYDAVAKFCFPDGFQKLTTSSFCVNKQFVFRLTSASLGGTVVYGVCTHFHCSELAPTFFFDSESKQYPFCFCFLTTNPMFAPHFQYLSFLALWINQQVKYIPHPDPSTENGYVGATENDTILLPGFVWAGGAQRLPSVRIPRAFLTELAFYRRIMTTAMSKQDFAIATNLRLVLPATDLPDRYILYPCLSYLFSSLSVKNIIKVYSLMLQEARIVFVSADVMKLTLSLVSAVQLLTPFVPNGTVMPVIPRDSNYMALLDSPVPFVAGIIYENAGSNEPFKVPEGVAVVNLDKDSINDPDDMPLIPNENNFANRLLKILEENSVFITMPQKFSRVGVLLSVKKERVISQEYLNFIRTISDFACPRVMINLNPIKYVFTEHVVDKIISAFHRIIAPTVETLMGACFVTETTDINNPVTVFNKGLFLDMLDPNSKKFYASFLGTTIFQMFCDMKADEKDALLVKGGGNNSATSSSSNVGAGLSMGMTNGSTATRSAKTHSHPRRKKRSNTLADPPNFLIDEYNQEVTEKQ